MKSACNSYFQYKVPNFRDVVLHIRLMLGQLFFAKGLLQLSENKCGCLESLMPRIRSTEYKSQLPTTYLGIYFVQACKRQVLVKTSSFTSITHSKLPKYPSLKFIELTWLLIQFEFKHVLPNYRSLDRYYRKIRAHFVPNISQKYPFLLKYYVRCSMLGNTQVSCLPPFVSSIFHRFQ